MVHTLSIKPHTLFQIRLENDILTMRGTPQESVGCVLRGQLVLVLTETTKIREIKLKFQGRSKVSWTDSDQVSDQRTIYQHEWIFLPSSKNTHVLTPANHTWDFELILPGTLPETIKHCSHGYVNYRLKATAERSTFSFNLQAQKDVIIQRIMNPSSLEYFSSMVVSNTWIGKVDYEISIPRKVFMLGDEIPVEVTLKPLQNDIIVKRYVCVLRESVTCKTNQRTYHDTRLVHMGRDDKFLCEGSLWTAVERFPIPRSTSCCLYDSQNDILRIRHKLVFYITFINLQNKSLSELRAAIPIVIVPDGDIGSEMTLPKYDEQWLSGGGVWEQVMPSNLGDSRRLPSYQSAANCMPVPVMESPPPAYDACVTAAQVH